MAQGTPSVEENAHPPPDPDPDLLPLLNGHASSSTTTSPTTTFAVATTASTSTASQATATVASSSDLAPAVAVAASPTQHNGDSRLSESQLDLESPDMMASQRPSLPPPHAPTHKFHQLPSAYGSMSASPPSARLPPYSSPLTTKPPSQYASYTSAPTSMQLGDSHRPTPTAPSNVTLPSMRTMEAISHRSAPLQHRTMNVPLPSVSGNSPYYAHHAAPIAPPSYGQPPEALARHAIPPHDPRIVGSRGPKKEIKRRTKTGCLTCRKRRIKCDETHPTCNNCKKSKRDCLGYDPIFRQQTGGQPGSNILPAPASQSPQESPASVNPPAPRASNSYGGQPPMLPHIYGAAVASHTNSLNTGSPRLPPPPSSAAGAKPESIYSYTSSAETTPRSHNAPSLYNSPRSLDQQLLPPPVTSSPTRAQSMKIDNIIDLLGPSPPLPHVAHSDELFNEITKVYHEMYAGGLSAFFETTWYYFVENGKMAFPRNARLVEQMAAFLRVLEAVKTNDHAQMASSGILETRLVWELAQTVYQTPEKKNGAMRMSLPVEGDPGEARNRVLVVEALLSGTHLPNNPLSPPVADSDRYRTRQYDFWYNLADFVRLREQPDSHQAMNAKEDVLRRMRHVLDGRENRDLLYSIAVVRHLAPNYGPAYVTPLPQHLDETDPKNRLAVASKFIMDESQVTGGTTNVVRRFSDIASRAFVNPGVNVAKRV